MAEAARRLDRALAAAETLQSPQTSCFVFGFAAIEAQMADEPQRALHWAARTMEVPRRAATICGSPWRS